jgi:hypothetical protein
MPPHMLTRAALHFADCSITGSANVRANQAFVVTSARLPYGMRVTVELPSVSVEGIVRWTNADGVGIQFDRPRARQIHALHKLMRAA